jgi:hypothetical protein
MRGPPDDARPGYATNYAAKKLDFADRRHGYGGDDLMMRR